MDCTENKADHTETLPPIVPPLLLADLLPTVGYGIVACLHGRCLAMAVSLAPLF
jgi:hypothetical protein